MTRTLVALLLLGLASVARAGDPADLVLTGAVVHTQDPARPKGGAIALRGGEVVGVADEVDPAWVGPDTRTIDFRGEAVIVPGLWDAHGHLSSLGSIGELDLATTKSWREVVDRVHARATSTTGGGWIVGRGWDQNDWPVDEFSGGFPTHEALTKAVPDRPVLLTRIDGHAAVLNAAALQLAGIGRDTRAPAGGEIVRGKDGAPTGVLVDAALSLVPEPEQTDGELEAALLEGARRCARAGLVGVHDAGVSARTIEALESLAERELLPLRVYAMVSDGPWLPRALVEGPKVDLHGGLVTVRAVKLFVDGALGSRGAWLLAPYSDQPSTRGLPQLSQRDLDAKVLACALAGFQPCVHAIGDAGVRRALDAFSTVDTALGGRLRKLRPRVEHAQVIARDDFARFMREGVLASMQPTHATSDMPWAEARLGPERVKGAYAWRTLRDGGNVLPLGSDFPVESERPLWGFHAAVTRLAADGTSPHGEGGWFPDQRLTREEALQGFTTWACYGAHQEQQGGVLAPGRRADVTVLGGDLLTIDLAKLRDLPVRMTIVGGRITWDSDEPERR